MTRLTVFELAQQEADEHIWVPTKATRFMSRLLSRRQRKLETISARESHGRQNNSREVRMNAQLRPTSRRCYSTNEDDSSPKMVRTKRSPGGQRSGRAAEHLKTDK